jgi:hypothetical protein
MFSAFSLKQSFKLCIYLIPVMSVALLCILPDTYCFHELLCAQFNHNCGLSCTCTVALLSPLFQVVFNAYLLLFLHFPPPFFLNVKFTFICVSLVSYSLSTGGYIRVSSISVLYFVHSGFISSRRG